MMKFSTIMQVFLLLALFSLGLAASLPEGISLRRGVDANTTITPMKFKGEIGGHYVELEGTIQEVYAQAQQLHPDIQMDLKRSDRSSALESRQGCGGPDPSFGQIYCWPVPGQGFAWTYQNEAERNRDFLWGECDTACCVDPGPGNCAKMSCLEDTNIMLCNDNPYDFCISCAAVGDYADYINGFCILADVGDPPVGGQLFSTEGFNVILQGDFTCPDLRRGIDDVQPTGSTEAAFVGRRDDDFALVSRQVFDPIPGFAGLFCDPVPGQPWSPVDQATAQGVVDFLGKSNDQCCAPPGPGGCIRYVCENFVAITICNDNRNEYCTACSTVALYAQRILNYCIHDALSGGQQFSVDGMNVIVNFDGSCPPFRNGNPRSIDESAQVEDVQARDVQMESRQLGAIPAFAKLYCDPVPGWNWAPVSLTSAREVINQLNTDIQSCCAGPGPGTCNTVFCKDNVAITLCNDNTSEYCTDCSTVAYYANEIGNKCQAWSPRTGTVAGGQQFAVDGMNVILAFNSCR